VTARSDIPRCLTIAGSDSGGGAGIQADLKAFAACGAHGMSAITAITAQSTVGVSAIETISPEVIVAQVRAVVDDIGVDAVKVGMLADEPTITAVAEALALLPAGVPVVVDPVMVAESGAVLLEQGARAALAAEILPRATVATPNLPEARVLAAEPDEQDPAALARAVHALGPSVVVVTGGHRDVLSDVFFDGEQEVEIAGEREPDGGAHGSGCTHSAALAACLARGLDPLAAARTAQLVAAGAVARGLRSLGAGAGPVDVLGTAGRTPEDTSPKAGIAEGPLA
jgi:hydroxymethylpyrimidine/phosphomethylpyrimidine kinase